ncbi:MAG: carboxypeptidase-like regulatory domain-containing protein [Candidatus Eremiobacteraeota bacterium]|nr:carboxypeptidase-like regulatory domain-containing protein [Candidatus Eremiobacteraeota bacterium]
MKWLVLGLVLMLGDANGGGCSTNPNNSNIGVQDYGSVSGRVLDATNNRPVPNALISVGALYTAYTDVQGGFTLATIPIGIQTVTASVPGYTRNSIDVHVRKNQTASVGYLRIVPAGNTRPTAPPPATPSPTAGPPEVPEETAAPATPTPSPAGNS